MVYKKSPTIITYQVIVGVFFKLKQFSLHFYLKTELESIRKKYIKPKPPLEIEIVERLTTPGMRIIFALISGGFIQGASCLTLFPIFSRSTTKLADKRLVKR